MKTWKEELVDDFSLKCAESRGPRVNDEVMFFANLHNLPTAVGTTRLGNADAENPLRLNRLLHNQKLLNETFEDLIVKGLGVFYKYMKIVTYTYSFNTDDACAETLRGIFTTYSNPWDSQEMLIENLERTISLSRP